MCRCVHPLYAAKALATVDHISHGRAGLNIVCGWNPDEFDMFGVTLVKDAYVQAKEWIDVIVKTYNSDKPLDFNGNFYKLKGAVSRPASLQRPRPVTMNAAFGPPGRDFAAQNCDHLFTSFTDLEVGKGHIADIKTRAAKFNRDIGVFTIGHVVCRPTQAEAEDYYDYYSRQHIDEVAVDYHMKQKQNFSQQPRGRSLQAIQAALRRRHRQLSAGRHAAEGCRRTCEIRGRRLQWRGALLRQLQERAALFLRDRDAADEGSRPACMISVMMLSLA